jgi:FkbM family methyltransferase
MNRAKQGIIGILDRILPDGLKRSAFHVSFHLARSEFDRFAHEINFAPHMEHGLAAVAKRGLLPQAIVDAGAFEGDWTRLARSIWPRSRIIMFEPNLTKQEHLARVAREINATVRTELLGAQDNVTVGFNVMGPGSSIFGERSPLQRSTEQRTLSRLDSVLPAVEKPAFLKIDAQGYELEILKGSTLLLESIDAILLEIAVIEINEGAPLLHEVLPFMRSIGFIAYDILEIHRRPLDRALNQIDVLFLRVDSQLLSDKRHFA